MNDAELLAVTCCPLCGLTRCGHRVGAAPARPAPIRPVVIPGPPLRPVTARGVAAVPARTAVPSPERVAYRAGRAPVAGAPRTRSCRPGVGRHRRPTRWGH